MMKTKRTLFATVALSALCLSIAHAATVRRMDLAEMCDRAERIFKGRVVSVEYGTIELGGSELPAVTYVMEVTDAIQGEFETAKGKTITTVRMLTGGKNAGAGDFVKFGKSLDLPQLVQGSEYVLVLTPQSAVGLTMTVGVGQGCFAVHEENKEEIAVNELGNAGLSATINGPVRYERLAGEMRSLVSQ